MFNLSRVLLDIAPKALAGLGAGLAIGLCGLGTTIGIGLASGRALEGASRQSVAIYSLVVSLLLIFTF